MVCVITVCEWPLAPGSPPGSPSVSPLESPRYPPKIPPLSLTQRCQCQSHTYMIPNMPKPKANINGNTATCNLQPRSRKWRSWRPHPRARNPGPRTQYPQYPQSLKFHAHNLFKDSLNIGQTSSAGEIYLHLSLSRKIAKLNCKL